MRRGHPFGVFLISALSGIVLLGVALLWLGDGWPTSADLLWSAGAGTSGALGITSLYTGLARARAAVVAPTTAVVGALIPVIFGWITLGRVAPPQLSGIAVALLGLWLVSSPGGARADSGGWTYGILGGLGVSGFLILIAQVESDSPFLPLVIARLAGVVVAVLVLAGAGTPWLSLRGNPWALGAGMLDAAGNVAYVVAVHHLRVDLAAVLSSLYPAVTVLLALRFMHQALRSRQWLGLALCLGGLGLIST